MKRFFGFFTALFITILFTSCSDSPAGNDGFQQQRIGSFMLTSETTAQWVGNASQKSVASLSAAGDSIYYDQPDQNSLQLFANQIDDSLFVSYIYTDSTMTRAWFDSTGAEIGMDAFINGESIGSSGSYREEYISVEAIFPFSCDSTYTGKAETMSVVITAGKTYEGEPDKIYLQKFLDVNGLYAATDAMLCL